MLATILACAPCDVFAAAPSAEISSDDWTREWMAGGRVGIPLDDDLWLAEAFLAWEPEDLKFQFGEGAWEFGAGLTGALGAIRSGLDSAVYAHLGPQVSLAYRPYGLRLVARSEPTYLAPHRLEPHDLGLDFQFTSSLGIFWRDASGDCPWEIGVAIQHISNAGFSPVNPGVEHIVFSVSRRF